jgi:hypothetical protein
MMANGCWTPTQERILHLLADNQPHLNHEVLACLGDELASLNALHSHLTRIRLKLRPIGQNVICEIRDSRIYYRHVRLISTTD